MTKYKFRAECAIDVARFIVLGSDGEHKAARLRVTPDSTGLPDCVVEFESDASLETLRGLCDLVPDGHVMAETISEAEMYTGERT